MAVSKNSRKNIYILEYMFLRDHKTVFICSKELGIHRRLANRIFKEWQETGSVIVESRINVARIK